MRLLQKTQSDQNTLFVFEDEGKLVLKINSLEETHSIYDPKDPLVEPLAGHYWNFITLFPYMIPIKRACVIGLGAGTITRQFATYHPEIEIDGVEIDQTIIEVASRHFGLDQHSLTVHHADGVRFMKDTARSYDLIVLDAFEDGNLSKTFMTQDFFEDARRRLTPGGLFVANYIHEETLHKTIKRLIARNFDDNLMVPIADSTNYLIAGSAGIREGCPAGRMKELPPRLRPLAKYISMNTIRPQQATQ